MTDKQKVTMKPIRGNETENRFVGKNTSDSARHIGKSAGLDQPQGAPTTETVLADKMRACFPNTSDVDIIDSALLNHGMKFLSKLTQHLTADELQLIALNPDGINLNSNNEQAKALRKMITCLIPEDKTLLSNPLIDKMDGHD